MAKHRITEDDYFDPHDLDIEFKPKDVSEPKDVGFDLRDLEPEFKPKDVSEPKDVGFDLRDLEPEFKPKDVSRPKDMDYDVQDLYPDYQPKDGDPDDPGFVLPTLDDAPFSAADVSQPRDPRKEIEIIEEALAIRRRDWFKKHMSYIYAAIGVLIVGLMIFGIYKVYQNSNPLSRLTHAVTKNFGTSFAYEIQMTEDGQAVMSYDGTISVDRDNRAIRSLYEADYNTYTYTGALYSDGKSSVKGNKYNGTWKVHDASDRVKDFFDFDEDFSAGRFDGGALLRFTGLTSKYSTGELEQIAEVLKNRLSTDSSIATINSEKVEGGTMYHYDINVYNLFDSVDKDGASLFFRSTDYDKFHAAFKQNEGVIKNVKFTVDYTVSSAGYLSFFEVTVRVEGKTFGVTCNMSDFGNATVELPQEFLKAARLDPAKK